MMSVFNVQRNTLILTSLLRCSDCGPWFLLCLACDSSIHASRPCHDREAWMNGYFRSISPRETINVQGAIIQQERCVVLREPECSPLCGATEGFDVNPSTNTRVIVTLKGCYELNDAVLACHSCESNLQDSECPLDAIDRGFWPGSPQRRTKYLFDLRLFEYYNLLQLNCPGLSESGFLKSLVMYSRKRGHDGVINPAAFSKAFHEWSYYSYEIERLKQSCGTDCPCCHMRQHSVHVDGNKKLYRYAKVPRGPRSQYFKGIFIAPNNEVEHHLELVGYKDESISDYGLCGTTRWKAAKSASKSMANLDETGLEVAGCRHGIAQKAVNLFRGEIFGYPHYLHKTYFQDVLCFWADVICQYWPWAVQKETSTGGTLTSTPCLSVMHANAHSWPCQVLWGGRWQSQAAASTGEDMEQLFSFLSRFNITTKNMTAAGREEQLTCAALFWNTRKIEGLARVLHLRLTKAQKQIADYSFQLLETTHSPDLGVAIELGRLSHCKVQECARNELTDGSLHNLADLAEYFRVKKYVQDAERVQLYLSSTFEALSIITGFHELYVAAKNVLNDLPVKKARLTSLERRVAEFSLENLDKESLHSAASATLSKLQEQLEMGYLQIQRKHSAIQTRATSSKQRSSLRRAITAEKKKVLTHIQQYNSVVYDVGLELPHLQESDIFDGKFPWSPLSSRHSISMREAYDNAMAYNRLMRANEEEVLLVQEMCAYISYFKENVLSTLMSQVQSIDDKLTTTHGCGSIVSGNSVEASQALPVYQYTGQLNESVLLEEKSILMDSVQKAQLMLAEGADLFRPFLNPGYTLENTESEIIDDHSDIADPESDCGSDFD